MPVPRINDQAEPEVALVSDEPYLLSDGIVILRRQQWSLLNVSGKVIRINGHAVPFGVTHGLTPFDRITVGDTVYRYVVIVRYKS